MYNIIKSLDSYFNFELASAHCDIPCKIYDPAVAQIAVLSMIRMVELIEELKAKVEAGRQGSRSPDLFCSFHHSRCFYTVI